MNCISIWQPWASAIQVGLKSIETRSWAPAECAIGRPIAIAAAKTDNAEVRACWMEHVVRKPVNHAAYRAFGYNDWTDLPKGLVVCTAVLTACVSTNDDPEIAGRGAHRIGIPCPLNTDEEFGDFSENRYAWFLGSIVPLTQLLPVVGRQGFFTVAIPGERQAIRRVP